MRSSSALARVALALAVSVLAGVLVAGLALPVVGGLGLVGKSAADELEPQQPPTLALPQRSRILDRDGGVLATLFTENRVPVRLADVPVQAREALIAIEDSRFYEHRGLDVKGTLRALARNSTSDDVQGGSTLTQQYVKNLLIETARTSEGQKAAKERSVRRKLQEARYALWLEEHQTKDQILEAYLNIAYYGSGVYGIGTAASHYFSVPVQRLSLAQSALLAGMVQSPSRFDPTLHPRTARARRNVVLGRMLALGKITAREHDVAVHAPVTLRVTNVKSGCEAPGVTAPFFCDYVRRWLEDGPGKEALGDTREKRQARLLAGGLTIRTTLDPKVQAAAQRAVDLEVPSGDPFRAVAVADVVEPGTGEVKAMAVDRVYGDKPGQTKVNFAIGGSSGFQGGSTFKAFVLARALQMGISPSLTLYAPQRYCPKAFPYVAGDKKCGASNAGDSESGTFDMVHATWESVNTWFIQLEERTGLVTPPGLAEALGVRQVDGSFDGGSLERGNGSFVLGTSQVSPLAMAGAYAAFADHGRHCPPRPVTLVLDSSGKPLKLPEQTCSQVLEPEVADTLTAILRGVIDGKGKRTGGDASIGRPAAGKTGTTNSSTAAWFVGYTPQLATAVWVGKATPAPMTKVVINGAYYEQVYGGTIPAAIWRRTMSAALEGVPVVGFADADLGGSTAGLVPVPDVRGLSVEAASDQLRAAGFGVSVASPVNAAPVPSGAVARTRPAAGTEVPAGSEIRIVPSNGQEYVAPPPESATPSPAPQPTTPAPTKAAATPPPPAPKPTKSKRP